MDKTPNYSFLPNEILLKIFQYSKFQDLCNLQQVCPKFKELIEDLKRTEIENDWRLIYAKFDKFGSEISATCAIKSLKNIVKDKYFKRYTLKGVPILDYTILNLNCIFNEVTNCHNPTQFIPEKLQL